MRRYIWFTLNQEGVTDSQELYKKLIRLITAWEPKSQDASGNVTYQITCDEECFEELHRTFQDMEFKVVWGVILSGVVENGQFRDWPSKSVHITPAPVQISRKTFARMVWNSLRKLFGYEVIK
jgi:hypothetical protein